MSAVPADVPHVPGHGHGDANLHPPPIHYSSRISHLIVGIFLFIGSEIMLFGSFFTVYFFCRVVNPDTTQWPPEGYIQALVHRARQHVHPGHLELHGALGDASRSSAATAPGLQCGLTLTFLLGLTFLLTQVVEYHRIGFNTSDGAFPSTFFGLTGLHGLHVFVGLTILLIMTIRAFRGHFSPEHHHGVEVGGIYWHFVDVMWIVVYVTVYVL